MRLILTESQLKLLESIIYENISSKLDKGGFIEIRMMVGDKQKSYRFEVTELHGGDAGRFATITDKDGVEYIISTTGSLNTTNNTFMFLKGAEYRPADNSGGGDSTHSEEVVGGKKDVVSNVLQVNISDSSKNIIDTIYTDLGDKKKVDNSADDTERDKNLKSSKERQAEKEMREKRVHDMIMNNKQLKKAINYQPTLFGGLLNYGKARGIGPLNKILSKYLDSYDLGDKEAEKTKEFSEFKVGKSILYQVQSKPISVSYGSENFSLNVGKNYPARYVGKQYIKGKIGGVDYKIYMKEKVASDTYKGKIKVFFKEGDTREERMENIIIKVRDYNY